MDEQYKGMNDVAIKALWDEIVENFVAKDGDKVLSDKNFTTELFEKLDELTKDYEGLDNLPAINGVELDKDTTWVDLQLPLLLQNELNKFTPRVRSGTSAAFDSATFKEGTCAEWFIVNHMTTVRLTVAIVETPNPAIENGVPVRVLTEILPPASDSEWIHLGRYSDNENVILEFQVDENGILKMNSLGQIPSDRVYHVTFNYISA